MNMYTLLKAANKTESDEDIFEQSLAMGEYAYIEDFTTWDIVDPNSTIAEHPITANSIKAETVIADNLIIANKEFDDIVRSIVKDALEEDRTLRAS